MAFLAVWVMGVWVSFMACWDSPAKMHHHYLLLRTVNIELHKLALHENASVSFY